MDTPGEWWHGVEGKRKIAALMKDDRAHAAEAWDACGLAVEFALKAVILKRQRFNRWPERSERSDLYTHDLRRLAEIALIGTSDVPSLVRPAFKTVLSWNIEHRYAGRRTPRRQARDMFEAAFGEGGVLQWLRTL